MATRRPTDDGARPRPSDAEILAARDERARRVGRGLLLLTLIVAALGAGLFFFLAATDDTPAVQDEAPFDLTPDEETPEPTAEPTGG